jgi:hypothetical protein
MAKGARRRPFWRWIRFKVFVTTQALDRHSFGCSIFVEIFLFCHNDNDLFYLSLKESENSLDFTLFTLVSTDVENK